MSVTGQGKQIPEKTFSNNIGIYYYGGSVNLLSEKKISVVGRVLFQMIHGLFPDTWNQ